MSPPTYETVGIAGSGAIACGLAATVTKAADVVLLARSEESAQRGRGRAEKAMDACDGAQESRLRISTDPGDLAAAGLVVESIVEDRDAKRALLSELAEAAPGADLATTTSSLSVAELAEASGAPERFFALHVFNPVPRMELVELCFTPDTAEETRRRAHAFSREIGKSPVEVPDSAGFVVNRLLFPYLFDAVRLLEQSGLDPEAIDECMTKGAGLPMGPLSLLDFVGIDVALAIGEELHGASGDPAQAPPERLRSMAERGELGRKSGRGFFDYDK